MTYSCTQQISCSRHLDKTVSGHKQMRKKSIRVTLLCLFGEIFALVIIIIQYLTGTLELLGIWAAIPMGTIAAIFFLATFFRLAKKGISISPNRHATMRFRLTFFAAVIIFGILAGVVLSQIAQRHPVINLLSLLVTTLMAALAVFFAISIAGLYWLERRYGRKLYIARRK